MKGFLVWCMVVLLIGCGTRQTPAPISKITDPNYSRYSSQTQIRGDNYQVSAGDTLFSIAWRAGVDYRQLASLNGIAKPYEIFPGQVINLRQEGAKASTNKGSSQESYLKSKNNKKTIANEKSGEYGKNSRDQQDNKTNTVDSFPGKIRNWRYPSQGPIIESYSTREGGNSGIDFGGNAGDPIIAAADGKVVYAGSALRGYGNLVIVKHNDDYLSAYAHNRKILVNEQDWVKAGQLIAEMGDTGTEGVKLHFEIRYRGRSVNPLKYLPRK